MVFSMRKSGAPISVFNCSLLAELTSLFFVITLGSYPFIPVFYYGKKRSIL